MTKVHSFLKKHWKPPYKLLKYTLLLSLIIGYINDVNAQTENNGDNTKDDVEVRTESTPYSIRFYIEDDKFELLNVTCKGLKSMEDLDVQGLVCLNLNPCSKYFATLDIKNEAGDVFQKTMDVETLYAVPTTEMNEPIANQESLNISWKSINPTCIKQYKLLVKSELQTKDYEIQNDETEKIVSELEPCVKYNITLETYDSDSKMVSSQMTRTQTLYAEPDNITITAIEEVGNTQMKVKWDKPKYTTCIEYYYIKWYVKDCGAPYQNDTNEEPNNSFEGPLNSESNEETSVGTTIPPTVATTLSPNVDEDGCIRTETLKDRNANEFILTNLKGCEDYGLEIYINTNETANFEPHNFKSSEQVPGLVTIRYHILSATDVILVWNQPVDNTKCVDFYKISLTGPKQKPPLEQITIERRTTNRFQTEATFDKLLPCGQYDYTIIGVSLNGNDGASMYSSFDTFEAKPTPVRNHRVTEEPRSIEISWDPPDYAELCLNGYRLTGWRDDNIPLPEFDQSINKTTILFDNLFSCTAYTVQIIPITKTMNDGELVQIETETKAIVASKITNEFISFYSHSLELSAKSADFDNNCETIFARFICEVTNSNSDVPFKKAERYVERGQVGEISFKALLGPLSPNTEYKCTAAFFNIAGWSTNVPLISSTKEYFPDPPESIGVKSKSKVAINFTWKAPKYPNGSIKLYISYFQRVEAAYFIPRGCNPVANDPTSRETAGFEQNYSALFPYTTYSVQVAAQNDYGLGEYSAPYMMNTDPSTSEPIVNLKVVPQGPYESVAEYKANVVVTWTSPCKSNGEIESFLLEFVGERKGYEMQHFLRSVVPSYDEFGQMMHNETNLKPEFNYTVRVAVKTSGVAEISTPITGVFDAPSGIPDKLDETEAAKATVDAYAASNPTKSAKVSFSADILDSESGKILYVALLLSEKNCNIEPQLRYGALDTKIEWPDTLTWNQVYEDDNKGCISQYQSTPKHWYPVRPPDSNVDGDDNLSEERSTDEVIEYVIGTEKCDATVGYCNGPLKPDTEYYLVLRLFTKSGFNDAAVLQFKTDSLIELTIILASVIGCLLLAFIVGFIYLWVTKRIVWKRDSLHGIEDSFGDAVAKNFAIFYRDVSKPEKIHREFKELTVVAMDLSYTASELGCNKNRYADIFPYDKNRVILDIDAEGSDYINASFIDGYRRKKEYIATQGPKPESTMDFWRMILQHNVRVIVMVTQFREGDVVKCHEYFPFKSKSLEVTVKKKECFEIYDRTEITLLHDQYGLKQKVIHFYFKKWPDHGVPTDPMHLITFVRKVKAEKVPSYSPIVVHCSAGVGRTGTFIGLDVIMQRLRNESKINIYETVKKLRFQRMKMVQTIAQYTFLYACAYELVKHKSTRAALKYQKAHNKKVTFEDDPEHNVNSLPPAPPLKFNGRRNHSDLSFVKDLDVSDDNHAAAAGSKQIDSYGSIPIRFNGFNHKGSANGLASYDDYDDKDFDSARVRNTESVM